MVSLLAKLFNKDPSDTAKQRQAIGSACGVIGIGLWIIVLGLAHLPELRRGAGRTAETVTAFFETLLPFLLGCTFIWCVYGSFDLSAPFYALTLGILALQRFR